MTTYYIDNNRGADGNDGLSQGSAWKNLSKINRPLSAGDVVALADDSVFMLPTIDAFVNCTQVWQGAVGNPVLITSYPKGGAFPTIDYRETIAASEWAWDATNNGWWIDRATPWSVFSYVKLGNEWGVHNGYVSPLVDYGDFGFSGTGPYRLYVCSPSDTNPTDHFGSVRVCGARGAITMAWHYWDHVVIENLKSVGGELILGFSGSGAGERTLELRGLQGDHSGLLVSWQGSAGATWNLDIHDCYALNAPAGSVHIFDADSGLFNQGRIYNNRFVGGNFSRPNGAIYIQADNFSIYGNDVSGCAQATRRMPWDGGGIYIEEGSNNCRVYGNYLHDMPLALIDNSGQSNCYYANVVENCAAGIWVTDVGFKNDMKLSYYNNTHVLNLRGGDTSMSARKNMLFSYYSGTPPQEFRVKNNICIQQYEAAVAMEFPNTAVVSVENNCIHGAATIAKKANGTTQATTGTITSDPLLSGTLSLRSNSPCIRTGVSAIPGSRDYMGRFFGGSPSVGAVQSFAVSSGL